MHGWTLAIDFGTSYTVAAALVRGERPHVVEVGGTSSMPSVVMVDNDSIVVGRAADEMAASHPERVLRAPKGRINDRAPVILGGRTHSIVTLIAAILGRALADATRAQGSPPERVILSHPATWSESTKNRLREAAHDARMPDVTLVTEPIAAATAYWQRGELAVGDSIAIYDLGGGTLDTAVLRATSDGFEIVGRPRGDSSIGGELFDELTIALIGAKLDPHVWERIQIADEPEWRSCAALLRREARLAKELLSDHASRDVTVSLPSGLRIVSITRDELDARLQPSIDESVRELARTITDAGLDPSQLRAIQLVGGSSKMPAVERTVRAAFPGVDLQRRGDPKAAVALGALLLADGGLDPESPPRTVLPGTRLDSAPPVVAPKPPPRSDRRWPIVVAVATIAGLIVALLVWLLPRSSDDTDSTASTFETSVVPTDDPTSSIDDPTTSVDVTPLSVEPTDATSVPPQRILSVAGFLCIRGTSRPELHVQSGLRSRTIDLAGAIPLSAVVSPDGADIALIVRVDGKRRIAVVPTSGGPPALLPFDGEAASPSWRPGSDELTFAGLVDGDWDLYSYDAGATATRLLVGTSSAEESPMWNEDGSKLAFASNRSGGADLLYVYDAATSETTSVAGGVVIERGLAWVAGSNSVVVATTVGGSADVVEVFFDGSEPRRLTTSVAVERDPSSVPGERIVVVSIGDPAGAYLQMIDLDSEAVAQLTAPGSGDSSVQALPATLADSLVPA